MLLANLITAGSQDMVLTGVPFFFSVSHVVCYLFLSLQAFITVVYFCENS